MATVDNTPENETNAPIELRQREVGELLGDPPHWLIHAGSYLLYGILTLFLTGAAFISYPDVVEGTVIIEDIANVEWITAKASGKIETIFMKNDSLVKPGDTIGIIQNPARLEDVHKFCKLLSNVEQYFLTNDPELIRVFSFDLSMGDMAEAYENFTRAIRTCLIYDDHNYYAQRKEFLKKELAILNREKIKNELPILKVERELFELTVSNRLEIEKNMKQLELAYSLMVNSLHRWEFNYLIQSHSEGYIVLGEIQLQTRMINKGDTIATVISNNKEEYIGRMNFEQEQIAGIKTAYPVDIRLSKFPEQTYGRLIGKISSITFTPYNKQYTIDIVLPDHLITTSNKEIEYELGLKGVAEILTSKRSVLSRILNPIYALWSKKNVEPSKS